MSAAAGEAEVLIEREDALGHVTLNRPAALNALTLGMVRLIDAALDHWQADPEIRCVLIDGAGERGLCAGGDIVALYHAAKAGDPTLPRMFWREEYELNARIARYPKPIVAIMDGVVMGGGVGISAHASHRLATERLIMAMPEVGIGFVPDVGGTYLLSRTPGELGTYLALTGDRIGADDALLCGLADRAISHDEIAALAAELRGGDVESVLAAHSTPATAGSKLGPARGWIDAAFQASTVEQILELLERRPEGAASVAIEALRSKSPTSLKVTLRALREARALPSLEACLDREYRISLACLHSPDFVEGVRAAVVDKDRTPHWNPQTLEEVDVSMVSRFFAPLTGTAELGLAS